MVFNEHEVAALVVGEALARKDHHFEAIAAAVHHTLEPELELLAWALALKLNVRLYETYEFVVLSRTIGHLCGMRGDDAPTCAANAKVEAWLKPPAPPVRRGDEVFYGGDRAVDKVVVIAIGGGEAWVRSHTGLNEVVPLKELHHS